WANDDPGSLAGTGRRSGPPSGARDCDFGQHACRPYSQGSDRYNSDRFRFWNRSGSTRPGRQPQSAGRQRYWNEFLDQRTCRQAAWNVARIAAASVTFGFLSYPKAPGYELLVKDAQAAASAIGGTIDILTASTSGEIDAVFVRIANEKRVQGLLVSPDVFFSVHAFSWPFCQLALRSSRCIRCANTLKPAGCLALA